MDTKDLSESKYEYLIENRENAGIKHLNDSKAFIECSMDIQWIIFMKILIITIQAEKEKY